MIIQSKPLKSLNLSSKLMTGMYRKIAFENNRKWLGWQVRILIDEKGKNDSWIGRNDYYKPVIVNGKFKLGDELEVKITDATAFGLRGKSIIELF